MKYTKPQDVLDAWNDHCYFTDGMKMAEFLDSLPAEFEIVQPGMTQVRWPEGATKENITWHADNQRGRGLIADSLYALAAIAPVEKKKRKMKVLVTLDFGTHKVGPIESECEVTG